MHCHFIPRSYLDAISKSDEYQAKLIKEAGGLRIIHEQGFGYPVYPGKYDTAVRLEDMAKTKVDMQVISCPPNLFHYWSKPSTALKAAEMVNNGIYEMVQANPGKFRGMGSLPMQDMDMAIAELHRCVKELGFKSIQIGSNIEGSQFDDPKFLPFFQECEKLGVFILLHPYYVGTKDMFAKYYLTNLYGNPFDTSMAIASLIFGGVFDKCPNLKIGFTHGGGFFPYQAGRLEHGYEVRTEPKVNGVKAPLNYLKNLYFDTVVFQPKQLRFLVDFAGDDHVMLGTDYAFDMQEFAPVDFVVGAKLPAAQEDMVLGGNARRIFDI